MNAQRSEALGASVTSSACDYCGLPLGDADGAAVDPLRYCCQGCRFAASVTQATGDSGRLRGLMIRLGLSIFFSMNVMAFTMYLWTQDETLTAAEPGQRAAAVFYEVGRYVCLLFATPVLLLLGGPLVEDAVAECRRARPSLSGLLLAGVIAAFGYSAVSVFRGAGHVYFEVSCMVLVAVALGRWMEAEGKRRTTEALRDLRSLLPDAVRRIGEGGEVSTPRAEIRVGDRVRVLAGERIAVDGLIEQGGSFRRRASGHRRECARRSAPRRLGSERHVELGRRLADSCHGGRARRHDAADH